FQAEDGIRDFHVTGVQTCALPIFKKKTPEEKQKEIEDLTSSIDGKINDFFENEESILEHMNFMSKFYNYSIQNQMLIQGQFRGRSEERRVGKECRGRSRLG